MKRRSIQLLPPTLVEKIAAGEIIERPASIVKELLENSIDAEAKRIEIRLTDGGKSSITVTDDGVGIPAHETVLALQSHATSKIESFDDLQTVQSYGFRGEALASIASVSRLVLITRTEDAPMGVRVRSDGGAIVLNEPYGMPTGTTVSVENLFYNTPVRRKFLRTAATELGYVDLAVRKASLALIDRSFYLENDGEIVFHLPEAADLRQRILQLYGKETANKTVSFFREEGPLKVSGYISNSHLMFSRPNEIWIYVNGRPVKDRMVQSAIMEGFRSALMERRYPLAVVRIEMPTSLVDVNVHPAKTEVRFQDPQPVFRILSRAIADSLKGAVTGMVTAVGETTVEPMEMRSESEGARPRTYEGSANYNMLTDTMASTAAYDSPAPYFLSDSPRGPFSSLDYLETLDQTFLFFKGNKTFVVIDQHAAHERVLFEKLKNASLNGNKIAQQLLMPLTMEINKEEEARLTSMLEFLEKIGFGLEPFGTNTYLIKAVPEALANVDPRMILRDILAEETHWQDQTDAVLSRIACHSAVRAHDPLSPVEIQNLLIQMDSIDMAANCPHGRPTFLKFTVGDFERLFKRK